MGNEQQRVWQNEDGTFSHHEDAQCRWGDRESAETDLRFHMEWQQ